MADAGFDRPHRGRAGPKPGSGFRPEVLGYFFAAPASPPVPIASSTFFCA